MVIQSLTLKVPVPAIAGHFSDKLQTFQTQVGPGELVNLLGHDPRSKFWSKLPEELREMYEYLQRKTNKLRREGTKRYIEERFSPGAYVLGAFPAIAIGCTKPLDFEHYAERYPSTGLQAGVGNLLFDLSATSSRVLLDGMARITGALDLADEGRGADIVDFTFPVTIYAPTDKMGKVSMQELGQLFHDFNFLASPVTRGQAIDLDQSNIYIQMANALSRAPAIVSYGGVEPRAASLGKKSTALVAKQVLLRFVRGACEGADFQERLRDQVPDQPRLTRDTFSTFRTEIESFLYTIAETMGQEAWRDHETRVHLTAPGWNALGVVFHDIYVRLRTELSDAEKRDTAQRIGHIDWTRWNQDFVGYLGDPAMRDRDNNEVKSQTRKSGPDPKTLTAIADDHGRRKLGILYGGRLGGTRFIEYIRAKTGLADRLRSAGFGVEPVTEQAA